MSDLVFEKPNDVLVHDGQLYAVVDAAGLIHECRSEVAGSDVCFVSTVSKEPVTPVGLHLIG